MVLEIELVSHLCSSPIFVHRPLGISFKPPFHFNIIILLKNFKPHSNIIQYGSSFWYYRINVIHSLHTVSTILKWYIKTVRNVSNKSWFKLSTWSVINILKSIQIFPSLFYFYYSSRGTFKTLKIEILRKNFGKISIFIDFSVVVIYLDQKYVLMKCTKKCQKMGY